jgi:YVTN family beta-propeller protein
MTSMSHLWPPTWCTILLLLTGPANAFSAYVSNEKANTVSVIDTGTWTVTKTIKVGQRPRGIEITREGKFVLVAPGICSCSVCAGSCGSAPQGA